MSFPVQNFTRALSGIKPYVNTLTITANDMRYDRQFVNHNIFTTTLSAITSGNQTTVNITISTSHFSYVMDTSAYPYTLIGNVTNEGVGAAIEFGVGQNVPIVPVSIQSPNIVTITFISGDIYLLNLSTNLHVPFDSASLVVFRFLNQTFNRKNEGLTGPALQPSSLIFKPSSFISSMMPHFTNIFDSCELVEVPIINIVGQTKYNGSDLGDVTFTILDQYQYDCYQPTLTCKKCKPHYFKASKLKTTQFQQCCPMIVSVVKGCGDTLFDKLQTLYTKQQLPITFDEFYERIFLYSMTKYLLARILYGDFNIDYLLRKYNKQFLKDLKHSRFCGGLVFFLDPQSIVFGYNQYFKKCL